MNYKEAKKGEIPPPNNTSLDFTIQDLSKLLVIHNKYQQYTKTNLTLKHTFVLIHLKDNPNSSIHSIYTGVTKKPYSNINAINFQKLLKVLQSQNLVCSVGYSDSMKLYSLTDSGLYFFSEYIYL